METQNGEENIVYAIILEQSNTPFARQWVSRGKQETRRTLNRKPVYPTRTLTLLSVLHPSGSTLILWHLFDAISG